MRIAIVGAGVSGLTAAYLLQRRNEVTVFESADRIGGHTDTRVLADGPEPVRVDTGFIVFNDRNYPNFEKLIARLGVAWQPSQMSFSVSDEAGSYEYSSASAAGLFATGRNAVSPAFYRMVGEVPRFQRAARALIASADGSVSLIDWLAQQRFSKPFVERLIVPQVSAVWSADPSQLYRFPALFLARFFDNHGMLSLTGRPKWRTIQGGSATYLEALTRGFADRIHKRAMVQSVTRSEDGVLVKAGGAAPQRFDHVVIATHSDQALALLSDPTTAEREVLGAIAYRDNDVVLHTDIGLLPRRRRAWASWNYHLLPELNGGAAVTYDMNRLQSLKSGNQYCVTLNLTDRIDPDRIIYQDVKAHPVYTPAAIEAQAQQGAISGANRTHYCGAYWGWGFHEDGVASALRVAQNFGETL
jgi:uncharacterized protein